MKAKTAVAVAAFASVFGVFGDSSSSSTLAPKAWVTEEIKKAEFTVVNKPTTYTYFVVTNSAVVPSAGNEGPVLGEASQGIAFDLYSTNSVYFIDDVVPTLKFFAPYRRQQYWPNQITAVEIGDETQVLRTHFLQVDGNLAVNLPQNIRFMSTLDRNAPYDEGKALSLQDYLDAFNPVLVPETIELFQTNRSNYSVGNVTAHDSINVADRDGNTVFSVTPGFANFMNTLTVDPDGDSHWYSVSGKYLTDENGVITNAFAGYASTDPLTRVEGNFYVDKSTAVSSNLTVWGKILLSSWEHLKVVTGVYKNEINKGAEAGRQQSLEQYIGDLVEPLVVATNEYAMGDKVVEIYDLHVFMESNSVSPAIWQVTTPYGYFPYQSEVVMLDGGKDYNDSIVLFANNKRTYMFDTGKISATVTNSVGRFYPACTYGTNIVLSLTTPAGFNIAGTTDLERRTLDVKVVVDNSGVSHAYRLDIGTWNFVGMGESVGARGQWETVYSTEEPIVRTETVIRTETFTWYDEIWDEERGEWVYDYDNPHTETYEWADTYDVDMVWEIEPYTCKEFHFKQVGAKSMRVEVKALYKTNPYTAQ